VRVRQLAGLLLFVFGREGGSFGHGAGGLIGWLAGGLVFGLRGDGITFQLLGQLLIKTFPTPPRCVSGKSGCVK